MLDFADLPVVDNHCHPYVIPGGGGRYTPLDTFLGVRGDDPAALAHRDAMLYQRWATRMLAAFLGCEPTPAAVAEARAAQGDERAYRAHLFADVRLEALVVDTGYPQPPVDMDVFQAETPIPIAPIYRIEPPIKSLLDERVGYDELVRRFDEGVHRAVRDEG